MYPRTHVAKLTRLHVKGRNVVEVVRIELSAKDVHGRANDAGRVRVAGCRQEAEDRGLVPFLANGVQHIQRVAALVLHVLAAKV